MTYGDSRPGRFGVVKYPSKSRSRCGHRIPWATTNRIGEWCRMLCLALATTSVTSALGRAQDSIAPEDMAFFENKIRPVLVEHCYKCHSIEASAAGKLQGGLLLDSREALLAGGDSGPAVVPHQSEMSLLLTAMHYDGLEMPPSGKLPESVLADFKHWIDQGAADPRQGAAPVTTKSIDWDAGRKHWAFQPLAQVESTLIDPSALDEQHPVDAWVQAAQHARGLTSSPTADARTLVRRVWFDLLGVPPTPEAMQYWTGRLQSHNPSVPSVDQPSVPSVDQTVWRELIDVLLAKPEYGERWARHWMDVARFAESYGYEQDYDRPTAYHYRDFLIRAFNEDMPYDRFVQWQIAGDELEPNDPLAWMATGFLCAGAFPTQLTETEFESTRYNELDDMTATTGVAFLGLSIGCARCHDHKFDPISSEDYYRFSAAFTEAIRCEKTLDLAPEQNLERRRVHTEELANAKLKLSEWETDRLPTRLQQWWMERQSSGGVDAEPDWSVLSGHLESSSGTVYTSLPDGSFLATGEAPSKEVVTWVSKPIAGTYASLRIEAMADASLPQQGPGRAPNGNFALGNLTLERVDSSGKAEAIALQQPRASHQQNSDSLSIAASLDTDPVSGWAVDGQIGKSQAAAFSFSMPLELTDGQVLRVVMSFQHPNARHAMGRIRFSVHSQSDAAPAVGSSGPPAWVNQVLSRWSEADQRVASFAIEQDSAYLDMLNWYKTTLPEWQAMTAQLQALETNGPSLELTRVMVTSEGLPHLPHHADDRGYPHFYPQTHLLRRGDVAQKVRVVEPGYPRVFAPVFEAGHTEGQLGPLEGTSPERTLGGKPGRTSHRRAALATWMTDVETGAGALVARVMVNRIWQHHFGQGLVSTPNDFGFSGERPTHPELLEGLSRRWVDSGWKLKSLHRLILTSETYMQGNRQADDPRRTIDPDNRFLWHHPPRRLEAEAIRDAMLSVSGLLDPTMYGPGTLDPNMKRRSIYFFIKRSQLIPSMMLFDWPEHLVSIGQRPSTTIAPQALMFMNSQAGRAMATAFAERVASNELTQSIEAAYRLALGRAPSNDERTAAEEFYASSLAIRRGRQESNPEAAALADVCQLLFCLNEFIYID
jgi:hypothetical protein